MLYYFIVNPISGCGRGKKIWKILEEELNRRGTSYKARLLSKRGEARQLAASLSRILNPVTAVIVGGDGSINEFVDGLTRWDHLTLGCIPTGSGNDFVRGLSLERDPIKALDIILNPREISRIKLGLVHAGEQTHAFVVSSGMGFDADVCNGAYQSRLKHLLNFFHLGKLVYLVTALRLMLSLKSYPIRLSLDEQEPLLFQETFFAAVMNLPYEGGGFYFTPDAAPEEETFQLCLAQGLSRRQILKVLPLAFSGNHVGKKGIHILTCKKAVLQANVSLCVHTDGEIFGFFERVTVEAAPERLSVIVR